MEAALLFSFGLVVFGPEYYASMVTESNDYSNCSLIRYLNHCNFSKRPIPLRAKVNANFDFKNFEFKILIACSRVH